MGSGLTALCTKENIRLLRTLPHTSRTHGVSNTVFCQPFLMPQSSRWRRSCPLGCCLLRPATQTCPVHLGRLAECPIKCDSVLCTLVSLIFCFLGDQLAWWRLVLQWAMICSALSAPWSCWIGRRGRHPYGGEPKAWSC